MPHATTKGAWIRPRHPPAPPPKPVDPIASNMGLLQYFAGTRQRSTSPTKPPRKTGGGGAMVVAAAAAQGKRGAAVGKQGKGQGQPKVKLPKGLGLEGLEGLQYRPPPPPPSLPPPEEPLRREVVEVLDYEGPLTDGEAEAPAADDEEEEEEEGEVVVVRRRREQQQRPRRTAGSSPPLSAAAGARYHEDGYYYNRAGSRRARTTHHDADYHHHQLRSPPPPPPPPPQPLLRVQPKLAATALGSRHRVRSDQGPLPHVGGAMVRRGIGSGVGRATEAREALERGIRERRLERFGREERGRREEGERGYGARMVGRDVGRLGSGSRAMREAITPLVM